MNNEMCLWLLQDGSWVHCDVLCCCLCAPVQPYPACHDVPCVVHAVRHTGCLLRHCGLAAVLDFTHWQHSMQCGAVVRSCRVEEL